MRHRKCLYFAALLTLVLAACQPSAQKAEHDGLLHIDVEAAMENLSELKVSDLGSQVHYVPLETNDSCLIGNRPNLMVLDKYILAQSNRRVLCFDKETGSFLGTIGHVGEDPKGYSQSIGLPAYNERNQTLYFVRQPNQLQKYDLQGNYQGKAIVPTPPAMPTDYAFIDTLVIGYYNNLAQSNAHARALAFFTETGTLTDTVNSQLPSLPSKGVADIASISAMPAGLAGILFTRFNDGTASLSIAGINFLWKAEDDGVRFKEIFCDTIYNIASAGAIAPWAVFDTGKWHFPAEARQETSDSREKVLPLCVMENDETLFFQCARGLYEKDIEVLNGVYDKQTGTTRMGQEAEWFKDDINHFMPFYPSTCGTQGEYAQIVEVGDIQEWIEKHPEAKDNPTIAPLLDLGEEDNPVVVLVK